MGSFAIRFLGVGGRERKSNYARLLASRFAFSRHRGQEPRKRSAASPISFAVFSLGARGRERKSSYARERSLRSLRPLAAAAQKHLCPIGLFCDPLCGAGAQKYLCARPLDSPWLRCGIGGRSNRGKCK